MNKIIACIIGFCVVLFSLLILVKHPQHVEKIQVYPELKPRKPNITNSTPGYQNYTEIKTQINKWKSEAPDIVETGTYGTSTKGLDLWYIKVSNLLNKTNKNKVLITACIHGNEPLATSVTMSFIGYLLSNYMNNEEITHIIDNTDVYFIPVVSPDSYPHSRHVDGVDPNRNFPGPNNQIKSIKPLYELQKWFLLNKFNAVISGHTYGRVYLIPYGDTTTLCPDNEAYLRIIGEMQKTSRYRVQRACEMYNKPIFGSEVDWYYRNGAISIVCEYGTHQQIPSMQDIKIEFDKTYNGTLIFIKEAPLIKKSRFFNTKFNNPLHYPFLLKH